MFHWFSRPRRRHVHAVTLLIAPLVVAMPTATAQGNPLNDCFRTQIPSDDGTDGAQDPILRLRAEAEDLLVEIAWTDDANEPTARLILSTGVDGVEIDSWDVARTPGESVELRLPSALTSVSTHGFHYRLRVEGSSAVRAEVPLRVTVVCPSDEPCQYQVIKGLDGSAITVSGALGNALAEARDDGASDLVAAVEARYPTLAGEIPGFLWQLHQSEPVPAEACTCRWLGVFSLSPTTDLVLGPIVGALPQHETGLNASGGSFVAGVQATLGTAVLTDTQTDGETLIGLQLLCTDQQASGMRIYNTAWPSLPTLEIEAQSLSSCPAPCVPAINFEAGVNGCTQATAVGRQNVPVSADSTIHARVLLDGVARITATGSALAIAAPGETARDHASLDETASATIHAEQTLATSSSRGTLGVTVTGDDGYPYSYGFAAAATSHSLKLTATSVCPEVPPSWPPFGYEWTFDGGTQGGGVAMETWESP